MKGNHSKKRVLVSFVSIFLLLFSSYIVYAQMQDAMTNAFNTLRDIIVPAGRFITEIFDNDYTRIAVFSIFGIMMLYSIFAVGISKIPAFQGENMKRGRLIAVSMAIMGTVGIYFLVDRSGGIDTIVETFGQIGVLTLSFMAGIAVFKIAKDANPEGRALWKIGTFLIAAGFAYYFFGRWVDLTNKDLGLGLLILGILFLLFGGFGKGMSGQGGGGGLAGGLSRLFKGASDVGNSVREAREGAVQRKGVVDELQESMSNAKHLLLEVQTREQRLKEHESEIAQFVEQNKAFAKKLSDLVQSMPRMNLNQLYDLLKNDGGVQKAMEDILARIKQKEERHEKIDKRLNKRIYKNTNRILTKVVSEDTLKTNGAITRLERKIPLLNPEQKAQAQTLLTRYRGLLQELNHDKEIIAHMLQLEKDIQILQNENIGTSKEKQKELEEFEKGFHELIKNILDIERALRGEKDEKKRESIREHRKHAIDRLLGHLQGVIPKLYKSIQTEENHLERMGRLIRDFDQFRNLYFKEVQAEENQLKGMEQVNEAIEKEVSEGSAFASPGGIQQDVQNIENQLRQIDQNLQPLSQKLEPLLADKNPPSANDKAVMSQYLNMLNETNKSLDELLRNDVVESEPERLKIPITNFKQKIEGYIRGINDKLKAAEKGPQPAETAAPSQKVEPSAQEARAAQEAARAAKGMGNEANK